MTVQSEEKKELLSSCRETLTYQTDSRFMPRKLNAGFGRNESWPSRVGSCNCAANSGLRMSYAVNSEAKKHSRAVEEESAG